ncbi:GntR family transcriptional regulator [Limibacter armeniacum]|uniref:GntR family transcriptional regulator n=1 Tax=Limibacter armeniacum TaxID=466084 RepID=UPI002FE59875
MRDFEVFETVRKKIDGKSSEAFYSQLYRVVKEEIESANMKEGTLLPREIDIAELFGVSRLTVKKSMDMLVNDGLVVKKKGYGTTVIGKKVVSTSLENWMSFSKEMKGKGISIRNSYFEVENTIAPERVCSFFEADKKDNVLKIAKVKSDETANLVYFVSYINPKFNVDVMEDFYQPLYDILKQHYGLYPKRSFEHIRAMAADDFLADKLNIQKGAPILCRERRVYTQDGEPLEYNYGYYRGDRIVCELRV